MPKKILVIDDDPKMLVLEKTILVQGGFSVETASDGVEGLEKLQVGRYDGIILDVMMPRMDGYETAKQIKKLEEHKATPIVMVTASVERSAMTQGFRSGAVVFMNKPPFSDSDHYSLAAPSSQRSTTSQQELRLNQLPQHVRQNATVLVVVNLNRRVDTQRNLDFFAASGLPVNY